MDIARLQTKISSISDIKSFYFDSKHNRAFIEVDKLDIGAIKELQEVKEIIPVSVPYRRFRGFFEFNCDILDCFNKLDFEPETFKVKVNFMSKIPISAKSIIKRINTLLKKEGLSFSEDGDLAIYVEFDKDDKNKRYLVSMYNNKPEQKREYKQDRLVILCFPGSVIEISDFLRVCYIFRIPLLILSDNNPSFISNLNKAKKMTKGIPFDSFPLSIKESFPSDYTLIGFSKLGRLNESNLASFLVKKAKIAYIFGDEKFGLPERLRNKVDIMVRLTDEQKKPLRASQALCYVLGIEKTLGIKK